MTGVHCCNAAMLSAAFRLGAGVYLEISVWSCRRLTICSRLFGSHTVLEIDTVAQRHAQQVRGAPDHIIFELADLAVDIDQLPHHFDNAESARLIYRSHNYARKMIEIDRLALNQSCGRDQPIRRSPIKPETAFDQSMKLAPFVLRRFTIDRNDVDQKRGGCQPISVVIER